MCMGRKTHSDATGGEARKQKHKLEVAFHFHGPRLRRTRADEELSDADVSPPRAKSLKALQCFSVQMQGKVILRRKAAVKLTK